MSSRFRRPTRLAPRPARALALLTLALLAGCSESEKTAPSVSDPPTLQMVHPDLRTISKVVGQPSFVQSYERTSVYPKMSAYIERWNVDIGDHVRKGDVLAELFVPELRELYGTKKATVEYDRERVRVAEEDVSVARADVEAARARLDVAKKELARYEAEVKRWRVQVDRLAKEVEREVVAPQILLESQNELYADIASRDAAIATIENAQAELQAAQARLSRDEVDVAAAEAELRVAESEARRLEAQVGYLRLFAPFDGIIVERNANTWDFVLPKTGDPTAGPRAPHLSPDDMAAPIYVVDRTDIVRIYVDIPERDAADVHVGSEARVKIWAYEDRWIPAAVTRIAWALNARSRTMRAEIDLPNPGGKVLPGMYAYGNVTVERPNVRTLPKSAIVQSGGKSFVWIYDRGRATRVEVETGTREDQWVEITNRHNPRDSPGEPEWLPIDGTEQVLVGSELDTLTEGGKVRLSGSSDPGQDVRQAAREPNDHLADSDHLPNPPVGPDRTPTIPTNSGRPTGGGSSDG
jgi:multidrug efflux pump subunit AcrA (membrane-fusion protein)